MFFGLVSFNADEDSKPVYKITSIKPSAMFWKSASGAEQTTETNNLN